jgi:hypothetical protein
MTVSQTGGTLSTTSETIGFLGNGAYTQTGGTHLVSGTLTLATNAGSLGTYTLNNAAAVLNAGTIVLNSGGTFNQTAGSLVSNLFFQQGGAITGTLTNQGTFIYSSGTFSGRLVNYGTVTLNAPFTAGNGIENDSSLTISPASPVTVNGAGLDNFGNLTLNGGLLAGSGGVTNDIGGVLNAHGTIGPAFTNYGQVISTGLLILSSTSTNFGPIFISGAQGLRANATFTNAGQITLNGGSLSGSGAFINSASGVIQGSGGISSALTNSGGLIVSAASQINVTGAFTSPGYIQLLGAGASLTGGAITNSGTIKGAGQIGNAITNNGVIRAESGELDLGGAVTNSANAQIQAAAGNMVFLTQGLATNAGTVALSGGAFDNNSQPLSNASTGIINGYGTLRTGGLTNAGKLNVGEGNMDVFGNVVNNGTIGIQGGRFLTFFGNVSGSGSYTGTGTATFLAALSPGNSPATVSFGGNMNLTASSALNIELGGATPGTQYDQVHLAGQLSLSGTLSVSLINGFTPARLNKFDILDWGTRSGAFSSVQLPTLGGALGWNVSNLYSTGLLSVIDLNRLPGDMNLDHQITAADLPLIEKALVDAPGYESLVGVSAADLAIIGDADESGTFDNGDLQGLLNELIHGTSFVAGSAPPLTVPEPASIVLLGLGVLAIPSRTSHRRSR